MKIIISMSLILLVSPVFGDWYDEFWDQESCAEIEGVKLTACWTRNSLIRVMELDSAPNVTEVYWPRDDEVDVLEILGNCFAALKNLQILHMNYRNIKYIHPSAFNGLSKLRTLELNNNEFLAISGMFHGLFKLNSLSLGRAFRDNETQLPYGIFEDLHELTELNLKSNDFRHIPRGVFERLTSLKNLTLSFNDIRTIAPGAFGRLSLDLLRLSNNGINVIETNTFSGLSVKRLYLSYNRIVELKPRAFNGLTTQQLDLRFNGLTSIGPNDFDGFNTVSLWLANNRIQSIAPGAFRYARINGLDRFYNFVWISINKAELGLPESTNVVGL